MKAGLFSFSVIIICSKLSCSVVSWLTREATVETINISFNQVISSLCNIAAVDLYTILSPLLAAIKSFFAINIIVLNYVFEINLGKYMKFGYESTF